LKAYWLRDAPTVLSFNNCTLCPHCICVFCIYLRTNSDFCCLQHTGWHKKTGTFEKPNKNWRNPRKKIYWEKLNHYNNSF